MRWDLLDGRRVRRDNAVSVLGTRQCWIRANLIHTNHVYVQWYSTPVHYVLMFIPLYYLLIMSLLVCFSLFGVCWKLGGGWSTVQYSTWHHKGSGWLPLTGCRHNTVLHAMHGNLRRVSLLRRCTCAHWLQCTVFHFLISYRSHIQSPGYRDSVGIS